MGDVETAWRSLPALKDDLSFNMDKDFEYVATTMKYSLVLSANPKLPIKSMAELVAYGKANPGKLTYAGAGTTAELGLALIMKAIGVQRHFRAFQAGLQAERHRRRQRHDAIFVLRSLRPQFARRFRFRPASPFPRQSP